MTQISGEDLIKKYEGFREVAYKCPTGYWTYGWGNITRPDGARVQEGDTITRATADALLTQYLMREVNPYIAKVKIPLSGNQKAALQSLVYNWSGAGFLKSKLCAAINQKDWAEAMRQWDYGFKNNKRGLFKRRAEELYYFIGDI